MLYDVICYLKNCFTSFFKFYIFICKMQRVFNNVSINLYHMYIVII